MATKYWVGGNSGNENDYGTIANWRDDSTDAVPAAIPVADDIVLFDARSLFDCTGSMLQGGVDLQEFRVSNGSRFSIGATGGPLVVSVSNVTTSADPTMTISHSEGTVFLTAGATGVDKLIVDATSASGLILTGGTYASTFFNGGTTRQHADCTVTIANVIAGLFTSDAAGAGGAIVTLTQQGGRSVINRIMTTANIDGGISLMGRSGTPTTLNQTNGSRIEYLGGTIANFNLLGGDFDPTGNSRSFTLGSTSGVIYDSAPGTFIEQADGVDITIGSTVVRTGKKKG